jgi:DMSO/TMAO reductase YedYZ molybdopterin-dependent catalytic subunit
MARHVAFKGSDIVPEGAQEFVRSIPIAKAVDPSTLIALQMNGTPLAPEHGFPARALVPGWIGSCSIKWLTEIRVLAEEHDGFYMRSAYRLPDAGSQLLHKTGATRAITSLKVKSIITSPQEGTQIQGAERVSVSGAAWAGERTIRKVEISTDGGRRWHAADLGSEHSKYAWRLWTYNWKPATPGQYILQARATDDRGSIQPVQPSWNPSGYLWNGIDKVRLTVKAG